MQKRVISLIKYKANINRRLNRIGLGNFFLILEVPNDQENFFC